MKLSTTVLAVLSASFASAAPAWGLEPWEVGTTELTKVPGDSPLEFCDSDHSKDIVEITKVDLAPNPPQAGSKLTIKAEGEVYETIEEGAYVNLVVKYGLIRLIGTRADLCEQVNNVDLECPIEKGKLSITKDVDIPKEVPPGTYNVHAEVFNADDTPMTCLQATVKFGGSKNSIEL